MPLTTTSDRETLSEPKQLSLFLLLSTTDLAEQLTIYLRAKFSQVTREDLVGKDSIGKWATVPNSGVGALTLFFNVLTKVVISEVLSESKLEKRKNALHYAILLGHELYLLNNFHAFYAVYCGITDSAIRRLAKTWANLPPKVQAKLDICHEAASLAGNYAFLVQRMEECRAKNLCLIPYLGIIQRDITMIVEKTKGEEREQLLVTQYDAMLKSVNGQTRLDTVAPLPFIVHLFSQLWSVSDDDELSEVSNVYEPRVRGESLRDKPTTAESLSPKDHLLKADGGGRRTTSSKEMSRKGSKDNVKLHSRKNSVPTQPINSRFEMTSSGGPESPPKRRESQQLLQQRTLLKAMKKKRNKHYQKVIFEYLSTDLRRMILGTGLDLKIVSENETSVIESNLLTSTTILQLRAPKYYLSMKQMSTPKQKRQAAKASLELPLGPDGLLKLPPLPSTPLINVMKSRYNFNINQVFNDYLLTDQLDLARLNLDELFGLWQIAIVDSNLARLSKLVERELFQVRLIDFKFELNSHSSSYSQPEEVEEQSLQSQVRALVKKWNIPEVNLPFYMLTLAPPTLSVGDKSTSESHSEREETKEKEKDKDSIAASLLLGKKKEREKQEKESTSKSTTPLKSARHKNSDSKLAPPDQQSALFEWPLSPELLKPFNFFCASHPDQDKRSLYIFTQKLEFYKTSTDMEDRKERGRRIMENHLVKNAPFFVKFNPPEAATPLIEGITEKIREYDLKAKWAMFLKAELANPDLCVFRPTLFDELEKLCDTMMKETVAVEFFKSPAFDEFVKSNPTAVENLKRRRGDSISQSETSGPDTPTTPTSASSSQTPIPTVIVDQSKPSQTTPVKLSAPSLSTPQSPTLAAPSPRRGTKSHLIEEQPTPTGTPDKLSQAVTAAASTEWPMRKDLFVVFGNFCSNHPRIAISSLFACAEMLEKFKSIENMGERKALGSKIYDTYFKKEATYKIRFSDVTFDAALDALAEKIDKYELQAKWAHFLKAEALNPDLCVYNQKLFETLEKAIDARLKDTVAPEFYKSKLYEEYWNSHMVPLSPTTRSRAGTQFDLDAQDKPKGRAGSMSQSSDSLVKLPAAADPNAWEAELSHYAMDFLVFGTNKGYSDIQITICDSKNESQSYLLNTLIIKENCPGLYKLLELESLGQNPPLPVPISHEALSFVLSLVSHFGISQLFSFTLSIASVVELMLKAQPLKIVNWPIVKNYLATRLKETTAQEASLLIDQYSNYFDESVLQELLIIHQESTQLATFLKNHLESLRRITIEVSRRYNQQIASLQARIEQLEKSKGSQTCARCAQGH